MKSALVKPQNARMSDSECGHVGLNACRFHVLKSQICNARVTVSVIMYDNESTYSSTSLQKQRAPCNCIVCIISIFIMKHTIYQLLPTNAILMTM